MESLKKKLKNIIAILLRDEPTELVIASLFSDEDTFLKAAQSVSQLKGIDAITPYPVHGLESVLKIKRSWIPWVTFIFGLLGLAAGFLLTWWTSAISWPLIIGGKPFFSLPAFVPVIFECTILFSALASVGALFWACGLPKVNPPVLDADLSSHQFALYCPVSKNKEEAVKKQFKELGAEKIIINNF